MTTLREAATQALEALEDMLGWQSLAPQTIQESAKGRAAALRAALAEPVEPTPTFHVEPLKWGCGACRIGADGKAYGYVCPRLDCPTKVTCGGAV